jgi:hypothetical protein
LIKYPYRCGYFNEETFSPGDARDAAGTLGYHRPVFDRIPEADWKVFRRLRAVALERFCERVLSEIDAVRADTGKSSHERYLQIYRLIDRRDDDLAKAFNHPRRSVAVLQLAALRHHDLLNEDEFLRLSEDTRRTVERFLQD